ncbi:HAD family hydrolase [bacterium]|nr:HAD family hydrolase [candidate division CSSED10-310 bacterium]
MRDTIQGIIFDLDGTLLDTIGDLADSGNYILAEHGFPTHTEAGYKQMVGDGIRELVTRMLPDSSRDPDRISYMVSQMEARYAQYWHVRTRVYDGITELLDNLSAKPIKLAVLSNKPHHFTVVMTEAYLSRWHFDPLWGAASHRPKKPDPGPALAIANYWNLNPSDCIFVGDSEPDIRTARAAGMIPMAVTWGFRSREQLAAEVPDGIIDIPMELIDILDGRCRRFSDNRNKTGSSDPGFAEDAGEDREGIQQNSRLNRQELL